MFEKVNSKHPDKIADTIAGAIVDLAYKLNDSPKIAVEVLIGHNETTVIIETDQALSTVDIESAIKRIGGTENNKIIIVPQDEHLNKNQETIKCGDNGIFKGVPTSNEEIILSKLAKDLDYAFDSDGKYIINGDTLIICQSNATKEQILQHLPSGYKYIINPLGYWTGGTNVDTGATNRKLGSDMGRCVTGGGLHGKDLSKADVSVNIYAYLKAQRTGKSVELCCAIGDETIDGKPYSAIVTIAKKYIQSLGGFEEFAKWGLI